MFIFMPAMPGPPRSLGIKGSSKLKAESLKKKKLKAQREEKKAENNMAIRITF